MVLIVIKGRFFCWRICPLGLVQEMVPSRRRLRNAKTNLYIFLFLFTFSFWGLNLLAFFDPLAVFNRAVVTWEYHLTDALVFVSLLAGIVLINILFKRFWCLRLCPLGALVDWLTLLKRKIRKKQKLDLAKRKSLILLGSGLVSGFLWRRFNWREKPRFSRLIRPPGALPEDEFTSRCIRCGSCLAVCLTAGLQPTLLESGWEGVFTPRLVPKIGECDEFCNKCGQTCPTQAIKRLPLAEKRNVKIGIAKVTRDNCIAWMDNRLCLVCKEFCPYLAIEAVPNAQGVGSPLVKYDLCRGCGLCEKQCRAGNDSAIKVYSYGRG